MRILVTNDDGFDAIGLKLLVKVAKKFGEVTVVSPESQCSAMSHRITIFDELIVKEQNIGIDDVKVYSVSGTPADCVRVAVSYVYDELPDIVFSGINNGYNTGYDIAYSGTIGAAMEALMHGIPAIAFSVENENRLGTTEVYIEDIMAELIAKKLPRNTIWNVNFPGIPAEECKGILWDRVEEQAEYHNDDYVVRTLPDGSVGLKLHGNATCETTEGTDCDAVMKGYISIGITKHAVMRAD